LRPSLIGPYVGVSHQDGATDDPDPEEKWHLRVKNLVVAGGVPFLSGFFSTQDFEVKCLKSGVNGR
jgi:hypothetical protein